MTWTLATGAVLAALAGWSVYAWVRRGRGDDEATWRQARGLADRSYEDAERIERDKAERLMREQEERERRGY